MKYTIYDHAIYALNKTVLYLLSGSFITYSICASTHHTKKPDRLELLVLDNLERAQSFNIDDSFYTFAYFSIGIEEENCSDETISIEKAGYYYFVFFPPSHPVQVEVNVTYAIRWIDPNQFSERSINILRENLDSHKLILDAFPQDKRSCLVAAIMRAAKPYVHIRLQFKHFLDTNIGMGIGGAILMIALLLNAVVFIICHRLMKS